MGLFSFLRKNKQQTDPEQGVYRSRADTGAGVDAEQAELPLRTRKARASKVVNQQNESVDPVLPEKKRARRRLVGAVALVLAVVIVLPMVLDSEPKPLAEDIAIQIPSLDKPAASATALVNSSGLEQQEQIVDPASNGLTAPSPRQPAASAGSNAGAGKPAATDNAAVIAPSTSPAPPAPSVATPPSLVAVKPATPKSAAPKREIKPKPESKPKPEPTKTAEKNAEKNADSARALAILGGGSDVAPASAPAKKAAKFSLQIAALASQDKVDELQGKLKEAGIRSYTQKVPTSTGERIRIRVGPFSSKEDAEKTRAKLAKLGLNGSLIPG